MARKEITGGLEFINAKKLSEEGITGQVLEGVFLGMVQNRFGGLDAKFSNADGNEVVINGTGSLNNKLKSVPTGTYCYISYNGKDILESGKFKGSEYHKFTVEVEDEESAGADA